MTKLYRSAPGLGLAFCCAILTAAALCVAAEATSQPSATAATMAPASAPATQPQAATDNAVLFMDWTSILNTNMVPTYDANRLSDEGREILAKKKEAGQDRKLTGHGMEARHPVFGVRIAVEKAHKIGPFLVADQPCEKTISDGVVIHDGDRYRCWYGIFVRQAQVKVVYAEGRAMEVSGAATCYAESTDGLHWTKPSLGLHSYNGSKDNNIVAPFSINAVYDDPAAKPGERYKGFIFDELPADEITDKTPAFNRYGLYGVVSPDGMNWTRLPKPAIRWFCDTWNIVSWDPQLKKYVGFFRGHQNGRAISHSKTEDFHNWPPPTTLLVAGSEDGPSDDYYSNSYTTYPGKPDLRLLFPAIYHQDTDHSDVRLAISHDGYVYNWVSHEAILDVGKEGQWDSGQLYAQPNLVHLPDGRLALPYNGYDHTHNANYSMYKDYKSRDGLAWAVWEDGRLAGVQADDVGEFYAYPFILNGPEILVNYRTEEGGKVEVELLERNKTEPLPGFSLADCEPLTGDKVWAPVRWKGQDLSSLKGKKLDIRFRLTRAKVFGYKAPDMK
ncbi:MAG: hypothetical protein WC869_11495 [Phycisphaerae bacterium]